MKNRVRTGLMLAAFALGACSTTGRFILPPNTSLVLDTRGEPEKVAPDGTVTTTPFHFNSLGVAPSGGIDYQLVKGSKVVKEGKLRAKLRVVSFFWPPFAIFYWPVGFNEDITYDLVHDKQGDAKIPPRPLDKN